MKGYRIFILLCFLLSPVFASAQPSIPVPTGTPVTVDDIINFGKNAGGFLMIFGGILAGIVVISSGIMYLFAGANTQRLASAKGMLKAGIIGALIIFSVGFIINTIRLFASNPLQFFQ